MKKILLAIVLLAIVVAVSYFKTVRNRTGIEDAYEGGFADGAIELQAARAHSDSLSQMIVQQVDKFSDSMAFQADETDSLRKELDSKDTKIAQLEESITTESTAKPTTTAQTKPSKSTRHREILAYYKKLYQGLPNDLSDYEKRVALGEIREDAAQRFSISISELNRIRKANNLSY